MKNTASLCFLLSAWLFAGVCHAQITITPAKNFPKEVSLDRKQRESNHSGNVDDGTNLQYETLYLSRDGKHSLIHGIQMNAGGCIWIPFTNILLGDFLKQVSILNGRKLPGDPYINKYSVSPSGKHLAYTRYYRVPILEDFLPLSPWKECLVVDGRTVMRFFGIFHFHDLWYEVRPDGTESAVVSVLNSLSEFRSDGSYNEVIFRVSEAGKLISMYDELAEYGRYERTFYRDGSRRMLHLVTAEDGTRTLLGVGEDFPQKWDEIVDVTFNDDDSGVFTIIGRRDGRDFLYLCRGEDVRLLKEGTEFKHAYCGDEITLWRENDGPVVWCNPEAMAAGNVAKRSDRIESPNDSPLLSGHSAGAPFPAVMTELPPGAAKPFWTPDGSRWATVVWKDNQNSILWSDGKTRELPYNDKYMNMLAISPDGTRTVCYTPVEPRGYHLLLDGEVLETQGYFYSFHFGPSDEEYRYSFQKDNDTFFVIKTKEGETREKIGAWGESKDPSVFAYAAETEEDGEPRYTIKLSTGETYGPFSVVNRIVFSPDGKHWVTTVQTPEDRKYQMLFDGVPTEKFDNIILVSPRGWEFPPAWHTFGVRDGQWFRLDVRLGE